MDMFLPALILFSNLQYIVKAHIDSQSLTSDLNTKFNYNVSESIVPRHYDINMTFTMKAVTNNLFITGTSNITFVVSSETQTIEFNYVGYITEIMLFNHNGTRLFEYDLYESHYERELFTLNFQDFIPVGRYTLYIKYFKSSPESVFLTSYLGNASSQLWFIYTNFKPYGARYLFPCWDQPGIKTTFSLTIKHDKTYTALSNTKWQRVEPRDEITTTQFRKTNKLYTSDVAIIIYPSDVFHMNFVPNLYGIAYHRVHRIPQFKFAFDKLISTKSYLFSYTRYNIHLDMQYVIIPGIYTESIPSSELIIFRENDILYNKTVDSVAHELEIMRLVTRTYLNLWFHYVVTPSSRTQMWVNEALAAFFQIQINIEQDLPSLFQVQANHEALHVDRNNLLMPIEGNTSDSFQNTFLSTIKAPVIFSMLKYVLTPPVFHEGVLKYLRTHKFKYASSDNLWDAMKSVINNSAVIDTDYDFKAMIYSWIRQPNYPVIEVTRHSTYTINISRSFIEDEHVKNHTWWIPITYTLRTKSNFSNTVPHVWLNPGHSLISRFLLHKTDWIIVNIQQSGYYRVNYEPWNWNLLANDLNSDEYTNIHVLNRAKLIDDAYYFMVTGHLNYNIFLNLTSYLSRETDYVAWYPMFKIMEYLSIYFPFPECTFLKVHMRTILDPLFLSIGFHDRDDKDYASKLLTQGVFKWACLLDNTYCKDIAYNNLKQHLRIPENHLFSANWKEWICCNGLFANDSQTQENMLLYLKRTKSYKQISEYLSCMKDCYEIYTFFQFILVNDNDRMTDNERLLLLYSVIAKCAPDHMNSILKYYDKHEFHDNKGKTLSILINHVYSLDDIEKLEKYIHKRFHSKTIQIQKNLLSTLTARENRIYQLREEFAKVFGSTPTPNKQNTSSKVPVSSPIVYDVIPLHYDIKFKILNYTHKHHLVIECHYEVTIMISHETKEIKMDLKHKFKGSLLTSLHYLNGTVVIPLSTKIANHSLLLEFEDKLSTGEYILVLTFQTNLRARKDSNLKKSKQIFSRSTKPVIYLKPSEAARIFPCWSDPALKSTFTISVHHRPHWYTAVSNMPIQTIESIDNETAVLHFFKSPPLNFNALVMGILPKSFTLNISVFHKLKQQTWYRPQFKPYIKYMSVVVRTMTIYFNYLGVSRNISKIDNLILQDLQDDVIGTYGLMLYDEHTVAYDKEIYPIGRKVQITLLLARALANQLFTDLVDASDTYDFWLNDGLPAYFAYYAVTQIALEKQLSKFVVMLVQHESLHLDINGLLKHTDTLLSRSKSPKFFASYIRAPAIARMLQYITSKDMIEFKNLVRRYVHVSRLENKRSMDLYEFIQKDNSTVLYTYTTEYDIPKLEVLLYMWTTKFHYPVVHVTREYSTNKILLWQENVNKMDRKKWWIPITYTTQTNINFSDTLPKKWLKPHVEYFPLSNTVKKDEWIIVNLQQSGYYRVNYDPTNWNLIAKYLNSENYSKIDVLNRAQIIDDAYHLMMMHKLDYDIFINLTSYLARETDYVAWYPMFKILEYLSPFLPFEESKHFKNHMKTLLTDLNKVIDGTIYEISKEDNLLSICLKQEAARWACILNDTDCMLTANYKLMKHLQHPVGYQLLPGWKEWTLCNGLSVASNFIWQLFWNRYENSFLNRKLDILSCSECFAYSNLQLKIEQSENITLRALQCNLLYFVIPMINMDSLYMTLTNLMKNIYYCATAPRDITKVLTVIINRLYFEHHFAMIDKFVRKNIRQDIILLRQAIISRHYFIKKRKKALSMLIKKTHFF